MTCRKGAVIVSNIPALVGAGVSWSCLVAAWPELLMVGRFITGISCGWKTFFFTLSEPI